jgi:hypothetical protein
VTVDRDQHPDTLAEALRAQACEAEVIQALGRLRPVRRGPDQPFFIDVACDLALPITSMLSNWVSACPGPWAVMADGGVILDSPADIVTAYQVTQKAARLMGGANAALTSISKLFIEVGARLARVSYKRIGVGRKEAKALLLPNGPEDLRGWLEARLGRLEWLEIERGAAAAACAANDNTEATVGAEAAW